MSIAVGSIIVNYYGTWYWLDADGNDLTAPAGSPTDVYPSQDGFGSAFTTGVFRESSIVEASPPIVSDMRAHGFSAQLVEQFNTLGLTPLTSPMPSGVDANGNMYVMYGGSGTSGILYAAKLNSSGAVVQTRSFASPLFSNVVVCDVSPDGSTLYFGGNAQHEMFSYDFAGGTGPTSFATKPSGYTVRAWGQAIRTLQNGHVLVVWEDGDDAQTVVEYDAAGSLITTITSMNIAGDPDYDSLDGLCAGEDETTFWAMVTRQPDYDQPTFYHVRLSDGAILSQFTKSGAQFDNMIALVRVAIGVTTTPPRQGSCCSDGDTLLAYGADDGAPLNAYFVNIVPSAAIGVGLGIDGSQSIHSDYTEDPQTAQLSTFFDHNDACGLPHRAFAIAGSWDGRNTLGDFLLTALRYTEDDASDVAAAASAQLVTVERIGSRHLRVAKNSSGGFGTGTALITVTNVFDVASFPFRRIEVIGSISSDSGDGFPGTGVNDGWVELRVDGVTLMDGDDFEVARAARLAGVERVCTSPRVTNIAFTNAPLGWNVVSFAPQGNLDCLYVKERSAYCLNGAAAASSDGSNTPCGRSRPGTEHPGGFAIPDPRTLTKNVARITTSSDVEIHGLALPFMTERYLDIDTVKDANGLIVARGLYDRYAPGAYRDLIADRRFRFLVDHLEYDGFDVSQANGRLECREDNQGLWFRARLPRCHITEAIVARLEKESLQICVGGGSGVPHSHGYYESIGTDADPKLRWTWTRIDPRGHDGVREFSVLLQMRSHFPTSWTALAGKEPVVHQMTGSATEETKARLAAQAVARAERARIQPPPVQWVYDEEEWGPKELGPI